MSFTVWRSKKNWVHTKRKFTMIAVDIYNCIVITWYWCQINDGSYHWPKANEYAKSEEHPLPWFPFYVKISSIFFQKNLKTQLFRLFPQSQKQRYLKKKKRTISQYLKKIQVKLCFFKKKKTKTWTVTHVWERRRWRRKK